MTGPAGIEFNLPFIFFTPALRLISDVDLEVASPLVDAIRKDPLRLLAHRLCARPDVRPKVREIARAAFQAGARLDRARVMLHDAELETARAQIGAACETWTLVESEWLWVQDSPHIRKQLIEWALELGDSDSVQVAKSVLAAVRSELLPLLHLKWSLLADTAQQRAVHAPFMERWRVEENLTHSTSLLYSLWRLSLPAANAEGARSRLARCKELLARSELDMELKRLVAARYAQDSVQLLGSGDVDMDQIAAELTFLEEIAKKCAPLLPLVHLRARLHRACGISTLERYFRIGDNGVELRVVEGPLHVRKGLLHLGYALVLDPDDREAVEQLAKTGELYRFLESAREQATGPEEVLQYLEALCQELAAGGEEVEEFMASAAAESLRARRAEAVADAMDASPPDLGEVMRRRLSAAVKDPLPGLSPEQTRLAAWVFSRRDPLVKLAALIGALLLLHAGTLGAYHRYCARSCDRSYQALLFKAKSGADLEVIAHAETFLHRSETDDPRLPQVKELFERALMHQLLNLSDSDQTDHVRSLLKRHSALLANRHLLTQSRKEN